MNREAVLAKIAKLFALANNSNSNEGNTARSLANNLIDKYQITEQEISSLEDKTPLYSDHDKLFTTFGIVVWKQQLALAISKQFDSYIIQEETVPPEGPHEFNYFIYADDQDVASIKFAFNFFLKKIDELILLNCQTKGPIYIDSYCEGVTQSIKNNIAVYGLDIPKIIKKDIKEIESDKPTIVRSAKETPKEKITNNSTDVNNGSHVKDILAYFKGISDGSSINIDDIILSFSEANL